MRLETLLGKWAGTGKRRTREILERGVVQMNGQVVSDGKLLVDPFDKILVGGQTLQNKVPRYLLVHKPLGVVSATRDEEHPTVVDLVREDVADELHLAGRLDRFTSGLVILTNDSRFSESLTEPDQKMGKRYLVTLDQPVEDEVLEHFREGVWFAKEKVMTQPALCSRLDDRLISLTIFEGKHHQIKRMFAHHHLKVVALHREAIGPYELPADLDLGEWREFSPLKGHQESPMI